MPETKHFQSIAKLLTDFQKVSFESSKDFPIFLLGDLLALSSNKSKKKDEIKKLKEEFRRKFYSIINVTYRKGFKPLLTESL